MKPPSYLFPPGAGPFERAYLLVRDTSLGMPHLGPAPRPYRARSRSERLSPLEATELVAHYGSITAAAKVVAMPRSTFRDLLKDAANLPIDSAPGNVGAWLEVVGGQYVDCTAPDDERFGALAATATGDFTCVICGKQYDANKATADRRGLCTRACEDVLEKKHGLRKRASSCRARQAARRALWDDLSALRSSTPGADTEGILPEHAELQRVA